jgi:hypothetical protein
MQRSILRGALSIALAGALAFSAVIPSLARGRQSVPRTEVGAGVGLAAAPFVSAAAAPPWGGYRFSDDTYAPGYVYGGDGAYARAVAYGVYGSRPGIGAVPQYDSSGVAITPSPYCPYGKALQNRC